MHCALNVFPKSVQGHIRNKIMKTILLLPFKILWFLIKLPFKILKFIFSGATVKSSGMFGS